MNMIDFREFVRRGALATWLVLSGMGIAHGDDADATHRDQQTVYEITHLPSLEGTGSRGNAISERGWIAGYSRLPGDQVQHAALWRHGKIIDLGSLGGTERNSSVPWPGINDRGMIVGISQTADPDPRGEDWSCSVFFPSETSTGYVCLGFVWEAGDMKPLPTLGGTHGFATGVNNLGQIVGWAENDVRDPTCVAPQVLQFRAALWNLRNGETTVRELRPLPGDTSSAATAINERGQAVGISGICDVAVGRFTARHAVLWNEGRPIEIDNLGGTAWHTPMAINERGDIVGFSNVPGAENEGDYNAHAFLWTRPDDIRDLGTLGDDPFSQAHGINACGQIVGVSLGGSAGNRAFLWENGKLKDLNTLVAAGYAGTLLDARYINDRGEITGAALDETGRVVAFVATPIAHR